MASFRITQCFGCLAVLTALVGLVAAPGCGGSGSTTEKVHGKVTLDGAPLPDAGIEFQPTSGRPSAARTDANGEYKLEYSASQSGAMKGQHTVRISTGGERPDPATGQMKKFPEKVPAKYNVKSELKKEVKAGDNALDFDLQSK
jgi:hypothetical protein